MLADGVLWRTLLVSLASLSSLGCSGEPQRPRPLRLATTTSVDDSGLLPELLGPFERRTGLRVHVVAVGTGQALALAKRGDADVVLVHDPEAEGAFMSQGHGCDHRTLMHNDFVLVGPSSDPAQLRGGRDAAEAIRKIGERRADFVSRGDESGTHQAERRLWRQAGLQPSGAWYMETGQGMGKTLVVAREKRAYCLVDRASFLTSAATAGLEILVEGDPRLVNRYSVIAVDPTKHPRVNHVGALALVAWLTSAQARERIAGFGRHGVHLFFPVEAPAPGR